MSVDFKWCSLSDFFMNATEDEKETVFMYAAEEATKSQIEVIEKAKQIVEDAKKELGMK